MKVVIIGAGIGGLCTGIALKQLGHEVRIYEQVREVRPVGAALSLWSNGIKCLNYLGLGRQVAALGGMMDNMAYMDGLTGAVMTQFSLAPLVQQVGQRPYPVSRAELQLMLMDEFGLGDIRLGTRMASLDDDGTTVTATFTDGTTDSGDMLIGADGAHSLVRTHVLGEAPQRRYVGYVNWNGLVTIDEAIAPKDQWTTFVGEGKRASVMPIAGNRFYFFFDVPLPAGLPNEREAYRDLLGGYFSGWAPPVQRLIGAIDPQTTNRVEIHDIEPFLTWAKGRVAILGDSAHNTSPDIGQGACMAMEDAVVLAQSLRTHTLGIEDALVRYQNRRAERARDLVLRARRRGDVTHGKDPAAMRAWYDELRGEDGTNIIRGIVSNIEGGPFG